MSAGGPSVTLDRASLGARRALPLLGGGLAWGLAFGALARTTGMTLLETVLMCGVVHAGTAQLAALALWSHDPARLPVGDILLTTLLVNARNVMLGVALAPWLGRTRASRLYAAAFFLTDETWALTAAERTKVERPSEDRVATPSSLVPDASSPPGAAFLVGGGIAFWLAWVGSAAAGHVAGSAVGDPTRWALDFAGIAAMLFLLPAFWQQSGSALPWGVAGLVSTAASFLVSGAWHILLGVAAGCAVGACTAGHARRPPNRDVADVPGSRGVPDAQ